MTKINNVSILEKNKCCGCNICSTVCPSNAINIKKDILGFKYPHVDDNLCNNCGICLKHCQITNKIEKYIPKKAYAVRHKDENALATSRSGGMFIALSDYVLENDGIVYGASFTKDFLVIHKQALTSIERDDFKNSKYIQSYIPKNLLIEIKQNLENGRKILFSGTPCQVAAIKLYLAKTDCTNLILVDIVCQGVASPKIWQDYIEYIEKKYKDTVIISNFRDKTVGWDQHYESFTLSSKGKIYTNAFAYLYYENLILRECCHTCDYSELKRISDITLGDFWGWEKIVPNFNNDNKGVSLILLNTVKGVNLFNFIKENINYIECKPNSIEQMNLSHSTPYNSKKPLFLYDFQHLDLKKILSKYSNTGLRYKFNVFYNRLKNFIKRKLQR